MTFGLGQKREGGATNKWTDKIVRRRYLFRGVVSLAYTDNRDILGGGVRERGRDS